LLDLGSLKGLKPGAFTLWVIWTQLALSPTMSMLRSENHARSEYSPPRRSGTIAFASVKADLETGFSLDRFKLRVETRHYFVKGNFENHEITHLRQAQGAGSRDDTRRFQAMGQLDSTRAAPYRGRSW
jgi:hypothetical protein